MVLKREELKVIFDMIIKFLEQEKIDVIGFKDEGNFYCKIWHHDRNFQSDEFLKCPPYSIGSLDEDIKDLKKVLSGEFDFVSLDLEKLGAILTALGATM